MINNEFLPLDGFEDQFYYKTFDIDDYLITLLKSNLMQLNFRRVKVPTLERQEFFSSEIVGPNPWPNWHPKSLINVNLKNYSDSYEALHVKEEKLFLIPEGTTSVCRWLASEITSNTKIKFPLKIFYVLNCFRNEPLNKISQTKLREFTQFGVEIFGENDIIADVELLYEMFRSVKSIGFNRKNLRIRISDVRIFRTLSKLSNLGFNEENLLKNSIDRLSSYHARNDLYNYKKETKVFLEIVNKYVINDEMKTKWSFFAKPDYFKSTKNLKEVFNFFDFNNLDILLKVLADMNVNTIIDLGVIRSQDYYSDLVFQMDISSTKLTISEVAGGGRYNDFMGRLISGKIKEKVYATGFAYGLERLKEAFIQFINKDTFVAQKICFNHGSKPYKTFNININNIVNYRKDIEQLRRMNKIVKLKYINKYSV